MAVSHPLIRRFDEDLSVAASIDGIDSTNALLGNLLAGKDVRTLRLSAGYSLSDAVSAPSINASISQGLEAWARAFLAAVAEGAARWRGPPKSVFFPKG